MDIHITQSGIKQLRNWLKTIRSTDDTEDITNVVTDVLSQVDDISGNPRYLRGYDDGYRAALQKVSNMLYRVMLYEERVILSDEE